MPELESPDELASQPFNAIVEADRFGHFLDCLSTVADEAKIHCTEDGLNAQIVDPANVAMVWADLAAEGCESYHGDGTTLGVNLGRLDEVLGFANAGDLVHLELDPETRMLDVRINNVDFEVSLIDPDAIRHEPDLPDIDLPASVTVHGTEVEKGVKAADTVSNHIRYSVDPEAQEVHAIGEGDTDTTDVTYGADEIVECQVDAEAESLFSVDYLKDLIKPIPGDAEVELRIGDEFPTRWFWTGEGGTLDVQMMLAPRVGTDTR